MGIFDSIFGNQKTTGTTTQALPNWIQNAGQNNYAALQRIVDKPYQAYQGQRVASLNPYEQNAYAAANRGLTAPTLYGEAANDLRAGTTALAPDYMAREDPYKDVNSYMNPYVQATLDPAIRSIQESGDRARNAQAAAATGAGAFGDARHGIEDSLLWRDESRNIGDATGQIYGQAFQDASQRRANAIAQALGLQQGDIANKMQAGAGLAGIEGAQRQGQLDWINAAAGAGQAERANDQANKDFQYQQYLEKRGWDQESINSLMAALSGTPYQRTTTSSSQPASGGMGSIIGSVLRQAFPST